MDRKHLSQKKTRGRVIRALPKLKNDSDIVQNFSVRNTVIS
jgi:hypothetical protein